MSKFMSHFQIWDHKKREAECTSLMKTDFQDCTMAQRALQSLMKPVILDYLSLYKLPEESTILQVLGEIGYCHNPGVDNTGPFMTLALSDGTAFFNLFVARGTLPGTNSLVRIIPSEKNKVIPIWQNKTKKYENFIYIHEFYKILDGDATHGRIGNPVEIINMSD